MARREGGCEIANIIQIKGKMLELCSISISLV